MPVVAHVPAHQAIGPRVSLDLVRPARVGTRNQLCFCSLEVMSLQYRAMTDPHLAREQEPTLVADTNFMRGILGALLLMTISAAGVVFALLSG